MHGLDLNPSLVSVLTQFTQGKVAIVVDVKSMFHQVKVNPQDTDALRFLWWPEDDLKKEPIDCRMLVHLFGATSSPSTAAFALSLRHTVELFGKEYSPEAVNVVLRNFYVDDMLMSTDSMKDGIQLANEVKEMLSRAGFDLHKWSSNCEDILNEVDTNRNESSNHTVPCKTEHCVFCLLEGIHIQLFRNQMLAVMILSQHRVSTSKTVSPRIPVGARCTGHIRIMCSAVCSGFVLQRHTRNSM